AALVCVLLADGTRRIAGMRKPKARRRRKLYQELLCMAARTKRAWSKVNVLLVRDLIGNCTIRHARRETVFQFEDRKSFYLAIEDIRNLELNGFVLHQITPAKRLKIWRRVI